MSPRWWRNGKAGLSAEAAPLLLFFFLHLGQIFAVSIGSCFSFCISICIDVKWTCICS